MTSQSRAMRSQSRKIVKFVKIMALIFLNCDSKFDLTDASKYDRKMDARPFDTIHDILRCLSVAQSLLKGRNAPISRIGNRGVKGLICHKTNSDFTGDFVPIKKIREVKYTQVYFFSEANKKLPEI